MSHYIDKKHEIHDRYSRLNDEIFKEYQRNQMPFWYDYIRKRDELKKQMGAELELVDSERRRSNA